MRYRPELINILLVKAMNKTKQDLIHRNFDMLSESIMTQYPGEPYVSAAFLYKALHLKANHAINDRKEFIDIRKDDCLLKVVNFIGYKSVQEFELALTQPIPKPLYASIGNWYYYARESTGMDVILRSPVKIWEDNKEVYINLVGGHRHFMGKINYRSGGLFAFLEDEDQEKELHLVFSVGIKRDWELIEGVFSGWGSQGIPVAGRAFLVRQLNLTFQEMTIGKLHLKENMPIPESWDSTPVSRLQDYSGNYIRVIDE